MGLQRITRSYERPSYLRDECIPVHRAAATWPASGHQGAFNNAACQGLSSLEPATFLCDGTPSCVATVLTRDLPAHSHTELCAPAHSLTHSLRLPPTHSPIRACWPPRSSRCECQQVLESACQQSWKKMDVDMYTMRRCDHSTQHEHLHLPYVTMQQSHRDLGSPCGVGAARVWCGPEGPPPQACPKSAASVLRSQYPSMPRALLRRCRAHRSFSCWTMTP